MSKRGRPTLLNAKLQKEICGLLAKGSSIKSACIQCGIGERSYHDWNERGKTGEEPYASFFSAATRAREKHKANLIAVVMEAAHKDARHAEWLLERQFPHDFAQYDRRPVPIEEPKEAKSVGVVIGVPDGSFERLMASNARMREQMDKYPPGTKFDMKNSVIIPPDAPPLPPGEDYLD